MFTLPELPYGYDALEPFIDEVTMHLHHDKHHQAYIDNLNKALEGHDDWLNMDVMDILKSLDKVPEEIRAKVKNNAGGHANHNFFWKIMSSPQAGARGPQNQLKEQIEKTFGSFDEFTEKFSNAGLARFGSGWVWLICDKGNLSIADTANQDSLVSEGKYAVLGLDVWEHAYYLKYQNKRADYIKAWWNVVNWPQVEEYFNKLK